MSDCSTPLSLEALVAYRRGELDAEAERLLEGHYFGCASCGAMLAWLEGLEEAVISAMRAGLFDVYVRRETVERLERAGSVVRKYDLAPGQSVNCTIAPGDDMTVVTLHGPLRPGVPVTVVVDLLDHASGYQMQQIHPSFQDQETGDVMVRLAGVIQKSLGRTRVTLTLRYGDGDTLDTVGAFVMNHAPWTGE